MYAISESFLSKMAFEIPFRKKTFRCVIGLSMGLYFSRDFTEHVRGLHCGQLLVALCLSRALVWNSASANSPSQPQLLGTGDVRSVPTLDKFKQCLKTHLFIQSYYS